MRIVFFDSGIGGLSVLHEAVKRLPKESYLYFADTLNVPYGTRSKEQVLEAVTQNMDFLFNRYEIKAVVVACNTATSVAINELRTRYPVPVVGMEPAVKPALEHVRESRKRVLVTATPLTLKERKFEELVRRIDAERQVDVLPLPELVAFAENGAFTGPDVERYLEQKLRAYDLDEYGAIVLGCTHFVFYRELLRGMLPGHIRLFDGNAGTVNRLCRVLAERAPGDTGGTGDVTFLTSRGNDPGEIDKLMSGYRYIRSIDENVYEPKG